MTGPARLSLTGAAWPDIERATASPLVLLVPVGSCEQHGPHLPFDVDTEVARAVVAALPGSPGVVVGPALGYGASGEHEAFPGTVSIGTPALTAVLVELGRSACRWASRVLFVNGHGGNVAALTAATTQLRAEERDAAWWPCRTPGDAHAGRTETALMLALRPAAVQTARAAAGNRTAVATLLPRLRAEGLRPVTANGVLGDPGGASAAEGERLLAGLAGQLRAALAGWRVGEHGRLAAGAGP